MRLYDIKIEQPGGEDAHCDKRFPREWTRLVRIPGGLVVDEVTQGDLPRPGFYYDDEGMLNIVARIDSFIRTEAFPVAKFIITTDTYLDEDERPL